MRLSDILCIGGLEVNHFSRGREYTNFIYRGSYTERCLEEYLSISNPLMMTYL